MENAHVDATPELSANNIDASLIHEAAIGKIAGDQLIKLMTLGLTEAEAEEQIINGFFKIIFENRKMHAQIYACIFIAYFTGLLPASYLFCGSPQYLHL